MKAEVEVALEVAAVELVDTDTVADIAAAVIAGIAAAVVAYVGVAIGDTAVAGTAAAASTSADAGASAYTAGSAVAACWPGVAFAAAVVGTHDASASAPEGIAAGTAEDTAGFGHTAGIHSAAAVEDTGRSTRSGSRTAGCTVDPLWSYVVWRGAITRHCVMSRHRECLWGCESSVESRDARRQAQPRGAQSHADWLN